MLRTKSRFDGDPTARIRDIRRVQLVVKNGIVLKPDELYRALGGLFSDQFRSDGSVPDDRWRVSIRALSSAADFCLRLLSRPCSIRVRSVAQTN